MMEDVPRNGGKNHGKGDNRKTRTGLYIAAILVVVIIAFFVILAITGHFRIR